MHLDLVFNVRVWCGCIKDADVNCQQEDMLVVELDRLMALVLRDFVDEWYKVTISAQDQEFSENVRIIVRDLVRVVPACYV